MTLIYGFMVSAEFLIIPYTEGVFLNFIAMFSVGIRMMLPCVISGAYGLFYHDSRRNGMRAPKNQGAGMYRCTKCDDNKILSYYSRRLQTN